MNLQWKPARPLSRVALDGELVRLEPVDVARHAGQLFAAQSSAPELWEYLPYGPFESETAFRVWLTERAATSDPKGLRGGRWVWRASSASSRVTA